MKVKIKNVINEFKSSLNGRLIGTYEVELTESESSDGIKFVVVNGEYIGVITHMSEHSEISPITVKFKEAVVLALSDRM